MGEDDGLIERELVAGDAPDSPSPAPPAGTQWSVTIRNGSSAKDDDDDQSDDDEKSGDDDTKDDKKKKKRKKKKKHKKSDKDDDARAPGEVAIVIYGSQGRSDVIALPSANSKRFDSSQTETYEVSRKHGCGVLLSC